MILETFVSKVMAVGVPAPIIPFDYIPFAVFVGNLIQVILFIAGILAVVYLVFAGIQYITAGGDLVKTSTARTGIVNAIIGIVVILLAFSIVVWVQNVINLGKF